MSSNTSSISQGEAQGSKLESKVDASGAQEHSAAVDPSAPDTRLHVIIIGAGIAGLAAARALRENHRVTVLESSRLKSEVGAAIHLGPNAAKICIDRWAMDLKRLRCVEVAFYAEFGADGEQQLKIPAHTRKAFGAPWLLNHRVDLHNELKRLATTEDGPGEPAVIRTSARVFAVNAEEGIVTLGEGEVLKGDVIIGADGIHSVTRTEVLGGDSLVAKRSGHSAYRTLIPREKLMEDPELKFLIDDPELGVTTFVAQDRRIVVYPCRDAEFLNIVAIIPDQALGEDSTESWSAEGSVPEMVASFSTFCDKVQRLLSYAPSCGLWQLRDQDPLDTWTKGRLIIIGDAAHAMLPHQGQGGGQSIEDAEAIGALLQGITKAQSELIPERLKLVEEIRIERASKIQGYSRAKALGARPGETLNASEFSKFNWSYTGALEWAKEVGIEVPSVHEQASSNGIGQTETHNEISPIKAALSKLVVA